MAGARHLHLGARGCGRRHQARQHGKFLRIRFFWCDENAFAEKHLFLKIYG